MTIVKTTEKLAIDENMKFWIEHGYNVLFIGLHGTGKTMKTKEAFNHFFGEQGKDWLYFSAATMDPWVDFIGVPKEFTDEQKKLTYLKLIRPYCIETGSVKAMFFDELNRAHKKVRNAVMELIQFHSINGLDMPNLKCIWGAINPEDNDKLSYDVDVLDPAQKDRFHIFVDVEYKPSLPYLKNKFGESLANAANDWWNALPEDVKLKVSPRRLDYALDVFNDGGDIRYVLPKESHIPKLIDALMNGSPVRVFENLVREIEKGNPTAKNDLKSFLKKDNNYRAVEERIVKQSKARSIALPFLSQEQIATLLSAHKTIKDEVFTNNPSQYVDLIKEIAVNGQNKKIKREAQKAMESLSANSKTESIDLVVKECKLSDSLKEDIIKELVINKDPSIPHVSGGKAPSFDWKTEMHSIQQQCVFAENIYFMKKVLKERIVPLVHLDLSYEQAKDVIKLIEWAVSKIDYEKLISIEGIEITINTPFIRMLEKSPNKEKISDLLAIAPFTIGKLLYPRIDKNNNKWFITPSNLGVKSISIDDVMSNLA